MQWIWHIPATAALVSTMYSKVTLIQGFEINLRAVGPGKNVHSGTRAGYYSSLFAKAVPKVHTVAAIYRTQYYWRHLRTKQTLPLLPRNNKEC